MSNGYVVTMITPGQRRRVVQMPDGQQIEESYPITTQWKCTKKPTCDEHGHLHLVTEKGKLVMSAGAAWLVEAQQPPTQREEPEPEPEPEEEEEDDTIRKVWSPEGARAE